MIPLLLLPCLGAGLSGFLCGYLGLYLKRLGLMTLTFTVLHAALAGAALSILFSLPPEPLALACSIIAALMVEQLHERFGVDRDAVSMGLFSLASSLAMLAIFLTPSKTLTSESANLILWGSILAMTPSKLVVMLSILLSTILYSTAFRMEISSLLFDPELAAAEGVNTRMHATILVVLIAMTITSSLKLIGGFMVFALLYNPITVVERMRIARQALASGILGASSGMVGIILSYALNTPSGATVALTASLILIAGLVMAGVSEKRMLKTIADTRSPA